MYWPIVDFPTAEQILVKLLPGPEPRIDDVHRFGRFACEPLCHLADPDRTAHVEHRHPTAAPMAPSTGSLTLNKPIVTMAARPPFTVKVDLYAAVSSQTSSWVNKGTSWQLQLTNTSGGSVPAGVTGTSIQETGKAGSWSRSCWSARRRWR
jgi:hypothetical protein